MSKGFDTAAHTYDQDFTHSRIGMLQRDRVWRLLDDLSQNRKSLNVLELNCGTGEDAIRLAKRGHSVVASDISEEMLKVAKEKEGAQLVNFRKIDLNHIENLDCDKQFDLVFSNFGGLNCIAPDTLIKFNEVLPRLLKPSGRFVAVIMPKFCLWETMYFLLRGSKKKAFRRRKEFVFANVSGASVKTWYYSPDNYQTLMTERLEVEKVKPIGLFIPPSYLESFFSKRYFFLKLLNFAEKLIANFSWQSSLADHYYVQYKMK